MSGSPPAADSQPGQGPPEAGLYSPALGARLHDLGDVAAAYSPLSGETHLLNPTCCAVWELVAEAGVLDTASITRVLAEDSGDEPDAARPHVLRALQLLVDAGLVVKVPGRAP